jgi:hypothetical protein
MNEKTEQEIPLNGWHFKKEVQLGHIITTLTVAVGVVLYAGKLEQRIALVEQQMLQQADRDSRQDDNRREAQLQFQRQLERMEGKLDRVIERVK